MPRKRYTPEQIINSLREAEVLISKGSTAAEAARHLGITEQTYYRWRKEYGGMRTSKSTKIPEVVVTKIPDPRTKKLPPITSFAFKILSPVTWSLDINNCRIMNDSVRYS